MRICKERSNAKCGAWLLIGDAGLIVPPHDSDALAAQMLHVMDWDDQARVSHGKSARIRVSGARTTRCERSSAPIRIGENSFAI